jgi:peptidoglycan/LPS O-acetylase OafA/YrhL
MSWKRAPEGPWTGSGRIPSLDGLRAVSILMVMWTHFVPMVARDSPGWIRTARETRIGVDVFFVISGFLITLLLLREGDRTGSISLRGFFARRALRLIPAFGAYLGFVAAYSGLGYVSVSPTDWALATTYTSDLVPFLGRGSTWVFAHLWSLSVEEHFYLAWPVALVALGRRRAMTALMVVLALSPAVRVYLRAEFPWPVMCGLLKLSTPARLDPIAAGCLLAYFSHDRSLITFRLPCGRADPVRRACAIVLAGLFVGLTAMGLFEAAIRPTLTAAAIACLVHYVVTHPTSPPGRLLNSRPMTALGVLSYSLYLWQQPFLDGSGPSAMSRWPANIPLAFACAIASHFLVERPFLRLKDRLGRRDSHRVPVPHFRAAPVPGARVAAREMS